MQKSVSSQKSKQSSLGEQSQDKWQRYVQEEDDISQKDPVVMQYRHHQLDIKNFVEQMHSYRVCKLTLVILVDGSNYSYDPTDVRLSLVKGVSGPQEPQKNENCFCCKAPKEAKVMC